MATDINAAGYCSVTWFQLTEGADGADSEL
jgi:hypothetical protein